MVVKAFCRFQNSTNISTMNNHVISSTNLVNIIKHQHKTLVRSLIILALIEGATKRTTFCTILKNCISMLI